MQCSIWCCDCPYELMKFPVFISLGHTVIMSSSSDLKNRILVNYLMFKSSLCEVIYFLLKMCASIFLTSSRLSSELQFLGPSAKEFFVCSRCMTLPYRQFKVLASKCFPHYLACTCAGRGPCIDPIQY